MYNNSLNFTGKRKTSVAQIFLKKKENSISKIIINNKIYNNYFNKKYSSIILLPLYITNKENFFDINIKVNGGGQNSQAEAIKYAISKVLVKYDKNIKNILSSLGYLNKDCRIVERKKIGKKKSRKSKQFSKR